ncbi:MAG: LVIVD repeat-containing protein [Haloglomus sp.]
MRRRTFLRRAGLAASAGGPVVLDANDAGSDAGVAAASQTPTPTDTPRQTTPVAAGTTRRGRLPLDGLKEVVTSPDGRTAYCATTDGFAVVDLAAPASPEVLVDERDPLSDREADLVDVYDVKLDGANDLLAVVAPANPAGDVFKGLLVYDVSNPAAPERVTAFETDFFNHNCFATGGYVYLCANRGDRNGLLIVDARAGEAVGQWSLVKRTERWRDVSLRNWVLHDVYVHDGVAYLAHWDAGTVLLDVSDPTAPSFLTRIDGQSPSELAALTSAEAADESLEPPGNDHYVATNDDGTLLGVGVESWDADPTDDTGGPGGVTLFDVSDPATPEQVSVLEPPPTPDPTFDGIWTTSHNFSFRGDRLYTSWYRGGVRVYDISDPSDPTVIARWRDSYRTSFWTAEPTGRGFFVAPSWKGRAEDGAFGSDRAALYTFESPPVETPTTAGEPTSTGGQPGFGPLAGLASLGTGALYALARRRAGERRSVGAGDHKA